VLPVTHLRKSAGAAVYRAISSIAFAAAARAVWAVAPDPSDAGRRLMLAVKQNLTRNIGGLAFRVEAQNGTPRLAWESGAVTLDANDVLNIDMQQDQGEKSEALEWLKDLLADGPVAVKKIQSEAKAAGLSWATVRRAKDALSVDASKSGYQGAWQWELEDAHSKDAHSIYTELSAFEEPIENKADTAKEVRLPFQNVSAFDHVTENKEVKHGHRPKGAQIPDKSTFDEIADEIATAGDVEIRL
jgi:hypothetical protein